MYLDLIRHLLAINISQGMKLGLSNMEQLQKELGYPDRTFRSIHVAGTNGKGSVCIKIAAALENAGYKVGLYTSPHISSFRERIKINQQMISEEAIEKILPPLFRLIEEKNIPATFFEITTLLALLYFAQEKVDYAVLETGLGGRLDATNVVTPCLSIITSISLDHTELLGKTIEEIAIEKAGIIKEKIPVIIGPHVPFEVIQPIAKKKQAPLFQVKERSALFEIENRAIAKAALEQLAIPFEDIQKGLEAKQPCRFEIIDETIVLDVAHNPDGIFHLFQALKERFPKKDFCLLFGLSKSKDLESCLKEIIPHAAHFHLIESTNGRAASKETLQQLLRELGVDDELISPHDSIAIGLKIAKREAKKKDQILVIFGTFFIMADVRQALGFNEPRDELELNEKFIPNVTHKSAFGFEKSP